MTDTATAAPSWSIDREYTPSGGSRYGHRYTLSAKDDAGQEQAWVRYHEPKRKGSPIHVEEVHGSVPGAASALLDHMESLHPGASRTVFLGDKNRRDKNTPSHHDGEHGKPTDWDTHYDRLGDIHRGFTVRLGEDDARLLSDTTASPAQHAGTLMSHISGTNMGIHWTSGTREAKNFANKHRYDYRTDIPVVLHAATPARKDIETRPSELFRNGVFPHDHLEQEVPLRRGRGVALTGISWRPDAPHPDADGDGWLHHTFPQPITRRALLIAAGAASPGKNYYPASHGGKYHRINPITAAHGYDAMGEQDWDDVYQDLPQHVHRGIGVNLPDDLHTLVHDPSRPTEERARALLRYLHSDEARNPDGAGYDTRSGVGTSWSGDKDVATDFAETNADRHTDDNESRAWDTGDKRWGTDEDGDPVGKPGTAVVITAHRPERHEIDDNPNGDGSGMRYTYWGSGEREVPVHGGTPMPVHQVSWRPMLSVGHPDYSDPKSEEYTTHTFDPSQHVHVEASLTRTGQIGHATHGDYQATAVHEGGAGEAWVYHTPTGKRVGDMSWGDVHTRPGCPDGDRWCNDRSHFTGQVIRTLGVHPEHRRRGVATAMLAAARSAGASPAHSPARSDAGDAWARSVGGELPERTSNPWAGFRDPDTGEHYASRVLARQEPQEPQDPTAGWDVRQGEKNVGSIYHHPDTDTTVYFPKRYAAGVGTTKDDEREFLPHVHQAMVKTGETGVHVLVDPGTDKRFKISERSPHGAVNAYVASNMPRLIRVNPHHVDARVNEQFRHMMETMPGGKEFYTPSFGRVDPREYMIAHELGHVHDFRNEHTDNVIRNAQGTAVRWKTKPTESSFYGRQARSGGMSRYGGGNTAEAYAEAFAHHHLRSDDDQSPATGMSDRYAERYHWNPRGEH